MEVAIFAVMRIQLRHANDEWRVEDSDGRRWLTFSGVDAPTLALRHVRALAGEFSARTDPPARQAGDEAPASHAGRKPDSR
jgi:hypothetical protein